MHDPNAGAQQIYKEERFLAIRKLYSDAYLVRLPLIDEESPSPMNFEYMEEIGDTNKIVRIANLGLAVFIKESIEHLHSDGEAIEIVTVVLANRMIIDCI